MSGPAQNFRTHALKLVFKDAQISGSSESCLALIARKPYRFNHRKQMGSSIVKIRQRWN
jgi:hypothetical protein